MTRARPERGGDPPPPRGKRSLARRAIIRARDLARLSALPDDPRKSRGVFYLTLAMRGSRRLAKRLAEDRIQPRAAGLAFHTLLAIVPIAAVTFALLDTLGILDRRPLVASLVERYFPTAAGEVVDTIMELVDDLELEAVGLLGLATLLPVMVALITQVELAMTDIFRTRRPRRIRRLLAYALLVIVAPVGALLTVQYTPDVDFVARIDRFIGPLLVIFLLLYGAFRYLPGARIRNRAAASGALFAALTLAGAKFAFGVWAADFASGINVVWGAVAFIPIVLLWVFIAWFVVLLGAEVAAVVQELILATEAPPPRQRIRRPRWRRQRHQRLLRRRTRMPPALGSG